LVMKIFSMSVSPYSFFLIFVLRMLCFRTKNFTHLSMMFLWFYI